MTRKETIVQELRELKSTLATVTPQNVYTVPVGYFEGLATQVLNRIKAIGAKNVTEELSYLSPLLSNISKQVPYSAPVGYFEGLAEKLIQLVRENNDYQTANEELETLSPLLSGLKKTMSAGTAYTGGPYSVPNGYFENMGDKRNKPVAKMVPLTQQRWFRYAAAAVVTGVIVLAGIIYLTTRNRVDPVEQPYAWVKKSIQKVDIADIDAFVNLANEELSNQTVVANNPVKPEEIKELMKDVSDKEIQDFLDVASETETNDETMMN
jgi:antitoxin (DNA-binding transcriptional repressor) of toxin-antitoxin stability system